jgi:hypothetical protein
MLPVMLTLPKFYLNLPLVYWILSVGLGGFRPWFTSTIEIYPINLPLRIV